MASIDSLPPELLVRIFKYLNQDELESCVLPVCNLWKELVVQYIPWNLHMNSGRITGGTNCNTLEEFLETGIKVTDVCITFTSEEAADYSSYQHLLTEDMQDQCSFSEEANMSTSFGLADLNSAFPELTQLQIYKFSNVNVENITIFHNLRYLILGCSHYDDYDIKAQLKSSYHLKPDHSYTTILANCPELKILDIKDVCSMSFELITVMSSLEKLESLGVSLCHDVDAETILAPLHSHPGLRHLDLYFHGSGNPLDVNTFLSTLPVLQTLSVYCEFKSDTNTIEFFKELSSRLTKFHISAYNTSLEERHLQQIYQSLPYLRVLEVRCSNPIREEGKYHVVFNGKKMELQVELDRDHLQDEYNDSYSDTSFEGDYHLQYSSSLESWEYPFYNNIVFRED